MTKTCHKCKISKTLDHFSKNSGNKDGLGTWCKNCCKNYYEQNKKRISEQKAEYAKNSEKMRVYYSSPEVKALRKIWRDKNRARRTAYNRKYTLRRRKVDKAFRIKHNLSSRLRNALKQAIKSDSTMKLIGCSLDELRTHLQRLFKEGMNWDNYGANGWHIDHVLPCASFDLTNPEQQIKCFHYSNLQPLWWYENITKKDKY